MFFDFFFCCMFQFFIEHCALCNGQFAFFYQIIDQFFCVFCSRGDSTYTC